MTTQTKNTTKTTVQEARAAFLAKTKAASATKMVTKIPTKVSPTTTVAPKAIAEPKTAPKTETKTETAPKTKVPKVGNPCHDGCGKLTSGPKRLFLPGHDQRLFGQMVLVHKGKLRLEDVPLVAIQNMAKLPKLMADERTAKVLRDAAALRTKTMTKKAA